MKRTIHGGDIYSYIRKNSSCPIDFSANINPFGLPEGVKKILKESVDDFAFYPDVNCNGLKSALSQYENINRDYIFFGNGAADLIYRLAYTIRPTKALLTAPTFSEYEMALRNVDCSINYYYLKPEDSFELKEDIIEYIKDIDILFICNPNNPTSMAVEKGLMFKIAKKCQQIGCFLVIDECFVDFMEKKGDYTFKSFLDEFDNVVIIKAFTKIFALAGLRLGYTLSSNNKLYNKLFTSGQPWSVSSPAQLAGVEALKDKEYLKKTIINISKERTYLNKKLKDIGVTVFEGYANFILFKLTKSFDLYSELYNRGILIRKCDNYKGLDESYFRIAVKSSGENKKLIEAMEKIL